ncbi:MAG TPA: DUF6056 family protein, partial [Parafilimonas sp.]
VVSLPCTIYFHSSNKSIISIYMREFFTDKNFIESKMLVLVKLILIACLFIFFLPLVVLPFFNHPFTDDFFCGYQLNNKGFIPYQLFIYKNWGGRFAATFAGSLFAYNNFLYGHYYLHSLLLLALNFMSVFFLVNNLYKYILKERVSLSKKMLLSFLFLALEICSLPQCSTFIFWFSSAITYQLPIVLLQTEIALFILYFNTNNKLLKSTCVLALPLLVFITIGCNEFFISVQLLLFAVVFYFKLYKKCSTIFSILSILAFITSSALLVFSPGNQARLNDVVSKKFYAGIGSVAYHGFETLWSICKTPFIWFAIFAIFLHANQSKKQWQNNLYIQKISNKKWIPAVTVLIFLIAAVSLPVAALKGGIIPDRYINAVAYITAFLLLVCFFIAGIISNTKILSLQSTRKKIIVYMLLSAGLLFNNYIIDAYKTLIIAPTYDTILSARENILKQSSQQNKIAIVKDYDAAISELLQTKYNKSTATFKQLIQQKPPLLFFEDDLADDHSKDVLKKYYGLDTIVVKKLLSH